MAIRVRYFLLALLGLLLLLPAALWLAREPLLRDVLRPWLAEQASLALNGEVVIEELSLAWGRAELRGVHLVRNDLEARFARLHIGFTFAGLKQQRVEELVVERPDVQLKRVSANQDAAAKASPLPERAPFSVTAWSIIDGALQVEAGEDNYTVQQLKASGRLGEVFDFEVAAQAGSGAGVDLQLVGHGRWQDGVELTLEEFVWAGRQLLNKAITIRPGAVDNLSVEVGLPILSNTEAVELLTALDRPAPWPEGLQWQVHEPVVVLRLTGGEPALQLRTGPGTVTYAGQRWPWESVALDLEQKADAWQIDARLGLAAAARAVAQGEWREEQFTGKLEFLAPQPAALAKVYGYAVPADMQRGRNLSLSSGVIAGVSRSTVSEGRFAFSWPGTGDVSGRFSGSWQGSKAQVEMDQIELRASSGASVLATAAVTLSGEPAISRWQGRWQLTSDDLTRLARQAGLTIEESWPNLREVQVAGRLKMQGKEFSLSAIKADGRLSGQGLSGRLHSELAVTSHDPSELFLELQKLLLDGVEYSNEEGTVAGIGGRLSLAGQLSLSAADVAFTLQGRGELDEALIGSWYGSLKELPLMFTTQGRWLQKESAIHFEQADFDLAGLVSAELAGRLSAHAAALDGQLSVPQLGGRFQETLRQLGGELAPALKDVALAGRLKVQLGVFRLADAWRLDLELQPEELSVRMGDAFAVAGLSGHLPFIAEVGAPLESAPERSGRLQWAQLNSPLIDAPRGLLELRATTNRWQLLRPVEVSAVGGRVRLHALELSWPELTFAGEAALSVEDVDLAEVSRTFDLPEVAGRFSATFDGIRFSADEIVTIGGATAEAFAGRIRLHNLKVLAPLSRYPTYHADIDFSDIDLHALTRTFAFGEINGVASGHVRDLRLFDGTPSAFDARVETTTTGTRNISVKAIHNLNTLSHGGLSAALSQGVYRFIDFYRYRKIGLSCSLRNDVFRLQGIARSGSEQYLIDGGLLPPKINIIVSSPVISFKEMVRRLKRIERTDR